jgi:hypothetical protein
VSSPLDVSRKFTRLATDITGMERAAINKAALTLKTSVQTQLAVAAPKGRLNVGKKGSRVGVRYTLYPNSAKVYMFGPAHLLERDTRPHRIPREKVGRAGSRSNPRRKDERFIEIPGVGVRAFALHPGTKGKHPWAKGVATARPLVGKAAGGVLRETLLRAFQ